MNYCNRLFFQSILCLKSNNFPVFKKSTNFYQQSNPLNQQYVQPIKYFLMKNPSIQAYLTQEQQTNRILQSPPSQRRLNSTNQTIKQSLSQILLMKLLKQLVIIYIVMTVLSIPFWVFSGIQLSKIKCVRQSQNEPIKIHEFLLLGTTSFIGWWSNQDKLAGNNQNLCQFPLTGQKPQKMLEFQKQQTFPRNLQLISQNQADDSFSSDQQQINSRFLTISLYYDLLLQIALCAGIIVIQHSSFKQKQVHKGNHIEDYSICLNNIPISDVFIQLPKLQKHLSQQLANEFQLLDAKLEIFDMRSVNAEKRYQELLLQQQLEVQNENGCLDLETSSNKIQEIQKQLKLMNTTKDKHDTVFITFQTRQARYLALRFLQSRKKQFMGYRVQAYKAPHPQQLNWHHLHAPLLKVFILKVVSFFVYVCFLLAFDFLILLVHKSTHPVLASLVILLLEIILEATIIFVSKFQVHKYKSQQDLSIFSKLTTYLYINRALILFVSCFDFGNYIIVNIFSTRQYSHIAGNQGQWFKGIGFVIMLSFLLNILYVNIRPSIQIGKHKIEIWIKKIWNKYRSHQSTQAGSNQSSKGLKLKSQLQICYAHIVSLLMFSNTYTITHPCFYPLTALFVFVAFHAYRNFIATHTQPTPYNNSSLHTSSIQYLYASLVLHCIIVYVGFKFLPALILGMLGILILLCKNTIINLSLKLLRRKFGPFCFSKFVRIHTSTKPLSSLLTIQQINSHILNLQQKIIMYTHLYSSKNEPQNFISRNCLKRAIQSIEQSISRYEQVKIKRIQNYNQKLSGEIQQNQLQQKPIQLCDRSKSIKPPFQKQTIAEQQKMRNQQQRNKKARSRSQIQIIIPQKQGTISGIRGTITFKLAKINLQQ